MQPQQPLVWINPGQDGYNILAISSEGVVAGNVKKKLLPQVSSRLQQGLPATQALGDKAIVAPLESIARVELAENEECIEIYYRTDAKEQGILFTPANPKAERQQIYDVLKAGLGNEAHEGRKEAGFFASVGVYLIALFFILAIGAAVWFAANDLAAGKQVEAKGRRAGMKALAIGAARALGPTGSLLVTLGLSAVCIGLVIYRLKNRPQVAVLERPIA